MTTLLSAQHDYELKFDPRILEVCRKAAKQLNILKRLQSLVGFKEMEIIKILYTQIYILVPWCVVFHRLPPRR